jgi:hypothetical protein
MDDMFRGGMGGGPIHAPMTTVVPSPAIAVVRARKRKAVFSMATSFTAGVGVLPCPDAVNLRPPGRKHTLRLGQSD